MTKKVPVSQVIVFPLDLFILSKYHPFFMIEYDYAKLHGKNMTPNFHFTFSTTNVVSLQQTETDFDWRQKIFEQLQDESYHNLTDKDIGNLLIIILIFSNLQPPEELERFESISKEFQTIITNLHHIEENETYPNAVYLQINNSKINKEWFKNKIVEKDEQIVLGILRNLKVIYFDKLHLLKEQYLTMTNSLLFSPLEQHLDLAIAISRNIVPKESHIKTFKELDEEINKGENNAINHQFEFKRMLYKTLLEYLDTETSIKPVGKIDGKPKKTSDLQYQTIYKLCWICGIVPKTSDSKRRKSFIKDVLKNFKVDYRFKFETDDFRAGLK